MNNFFRLSVPKSKNKHGITIQKLNNRKFYDLIGRLEDLPETFLNELFPKKESEEILELLINMTAEDIFFLAPRILKILPDKITSLLAEMLGCEKDYLLDELGPIELAELLEEFWRINRLGEFSEILRRNLKTLRKTWEKKAENQKAKGGSRSS